MRNFYCFILLFAISFGVDAQIFNAGFEDNNGTPLSEFKTVNNDSLQVPPYAEVPEFNEEAWIQFYDGFDNKIAFSTSNYTPSGQSDDWLITPSIEIPEEGTPTLYWKAKSYAAENPDSYQVRISQSNDSLSSFTDTILTVDGEQPFDFNSRQLNLSDYKGETIYIAFINTTEEGYYLALDDLYISDSDNCPIPSIDDFEVSDLAEDGFTVSWNNNSDISSYDTGLTTFDVPVTSTGVQDDTTKTYTDLESGTRYQFFLKNNDCGSGWSSPRSVWTPFIPPYDYGFEYTEENYGEYGSDGWSSATWLNSSGNDRAQSGEGYIFNNTSTEYDTDAWIYSPPFKLSNQEELTVTYYVQLARDVADPATLQIAVASSQNQEGNIQIIENQQIEYSEDYNQYTATFVPEETGIYYIGFGNVTPQVENYDGPLRLDNIQFTTEDLDVDQQKISELKVYPNPVKNRLHIDSKTGVKSVRVFDISGKEVTTDFKHNDIDFSPLSKGVYFVKIQTNSGVTVKKVVK